MTVADQQVALEAKGEALVELEAQLEQQAAETEAAQRAASRALREELDAAHAAERVAMEKDWRETIDVRIALSILCRALSAPAAVWRASGERRLSVKLLLLH